MSSLIRPLPILNNTNKQEYDRLLRKNSFIYAIPEDYSFEEILAHIIAKEMGCSTLEESKQELIDILKSIDVNDIQKSLLPEAGKT